MQSIVNREARHNYEFLKSWDAGIVLHGGEVKSVKAGQMQLKGAYVSIENGQLWLVKAHISAYQRSNQPNYDPERPRKLLLTKQEIATIHGKLNDKGLTIVPEKVYSKAGFIKVKVALARGLKKHDKRDRMKKRDADRQTDRLLKQQ